MKKTIIALCALSIVACKEEPKDYVTFSGTISNKNSDSLVVRTRTYSKTIKVNEDGTFKDTLKVEPGVYNLYDGSESTNVFLKNGFDLQMTIDTKLFDETAKYTGVGAEHSNFIAEKALLEEKLLDLDKLGDLDSASVEKAFNDIKSELSEFYNSNKNIDTTVVNSANKSLEPMLGSYKRYIDQKIALKAELPAGTESPTFVDYENYAGGTTSLEDLKGKYTYIDIWATWCGPCKVEIPAIKELEEEYKDKNIQFLSISIDDDKAHKGSWEKANENWRAMVADENLVGIQLFAPKGWNSQFIRDYKINGIPRFILVDPDGKIVSPDAPRPSSKKIKEVLNELL
ncbi:TlpA disulfide reductase family protein [Oceanihabitans sediminis]|uniref:TlpA family protein disulfide reductase n=1 Tax=Oceanihabitans sediminis TaxID=1812012 RepID=A0A368P7W2_9FLAO|nr:TlpA disulfide reductase family protein [Oceanihabitans sediminis]MDX1278212.1 TlpA disulfide reductase family protein [Oceanihabitans sediminis]MDX1773717.1 TlpA disulfide reductase family protein [Oceanihabitans sediminis]RBP33162.1 redoxin [Oceanihabitans sediminis]RCU57331.1 TlpA family protein disulfide reductase [Oceanihabitans sediminis]